MSTPSSFEQLRDYKRLKPCDKTAEVTMRFAEHLTRELKKEKLKFKTYIQKLEACYIAEMVDLLTPGPGTANTLELAMVEVADFEL